MFTLRKALFIFALTAFTSCGSDDHSFNIAEEGGTEITVEADVKTFLREKSGFIGSPSFKQLINAIPSVPRKPAFETIKDFVKDADRQGIKLSPVFMLADKENFNFKMNNSEVEKKLIELFQRDMARVAIILETRLTSLGLQKFNVQNKHYLLKIEIGDEVDSKRLRNLVQSTARLGFYTTYEASEAFRDFEKLNKAVVALLAPPDSTHEGNIDSTANMRMDEYPLMKIVQLSLLQGERGQLTWMKGARIGLIDVRDTGLFNDYLRRIDFTAHNISPDLHFMYSAKPEHQNPQEGPAQKTFLGIYCIRSLDVNIPELSGKDVVEAHMTENEQTRSPQVNLTFNGDATEKWRKLTKQNIEKAIAIVMDGYVYTAPTVIGEIPNGLSVISGKFTVDEASDLANVLKAGYLPMPVHITGEKTIKGK